MILNLIFIWIITVIIIDISGIVDSIKMLIAKILTKGKIPTNDFRMKPFDCSFCMNFWLGLAYILLVGQFSLGLLAFILVLSVFTPILKDIIILLKDLFIKLINKIYDILEND